VKIAGEIGVRAAVIFYSESYFCCKIDRARSFGHLTCKKAVLFEKKLIFFAGLAIVSSFRQNAQKAMLRSESLAFSGKPMAD